MRRTPELVHARVTSEVKAAIVQLAEQCYEANQSMATRFVLERGLADLRREEDGDEERQAA